MVLSLTYETSQPASSRALFGPYIPEAVYHIEPGPLCLEMNTSGLMLLLMIGQSPSRPLARHTTPAVPSAATECYSLVSSPAGSHAGPAGLASLLGAASRQASLSGGYWSSPKPRVPPVLAGRYQAPAAQRCSCTGHAEPDESGGAHWLLALCAGLQPWWRAGRGHLVA